MGAEHTNTQQGVIPTATLHPLRDLTLVNQRTSMPTLIDLEDVLEPTQVDVVARLHRQQVTGSSVVRDDVASHPRQRRRIRRQLNEQSGMSPRI